MKKCGIIGAAADAALVWSSSTRTSVGVRLQFYPARLQTLSAECNAHAPIRSSVFCHSHCQAWCQGYFCIYLSSSWHSLINKAFRLISQLIFTFRCRLDASDLPRLLESPPGVDTVAALPAPRIPPFPGVPDQTSSSGLEAEKNYNENHRVRYCVAKSIW